MLEFDGYIPEVGPREYVCQNHGCWLIHLRTAGDAACDAVD